MSTVRKAYRLKLYPRKTQRSGFARHAGSCRWLWNHLLAMQQARYQAEGKFVFFHDMSKLLPGLKKDHPWLAEAPSNALVRVCKNLDKALRDGFRKDEPRRGFPRFKVRGKSRESFYVINQAMRVTSLGPQGPSFSFRKESFLLPAAYAARSAGQPRRSSG